MGVKNTVISSMIQKGGNGKLSAIQSALLNENEAAKKTDLKKDKKK